MQRQTGPTASPAHSATATSDPPPAVFSLFSGGGGLDLGLAAAGLPSSVATDIDHHSCITLQQLNRLPPELAHQGPVPILHQDIRELDPVAVAEAAGFRPGEIGVLSGGPPCQAFSVFGKRRGLEDPRGTLAFEYLRVLRALQPATFVFENVYGLMTMDNGKLLDTILEELRTPLPGLTYEISVHRLDAVDFGVPQFRDRVFLIGSRTGTTVSHIPRWVSADGDLFDSTSPRRRTVRDALRDLPPAESGYPSNHTGRNHSERILRRYAALSPGERDPKTRINKLDLDRPSFIIIVGSDKGGGKGHVHPTEPREVTPRESARIQTFPDWWEFSGTTRHPIRQVGNAVPPLLAAAVGSAVASQIFGLPPITLSEAVSRLGQDHLFGEPASS